MQNVNIATAKAKLSEFIIGAALGKERIVLKRRDKPAAVLMGYEDYRRLEELEDAFESALLKRALTKKRFYLLEEVVSKLKLEI